ncbi:MAG: 4Fe-4S dicluster domain-containing protein [Kineosporiaceae bacterium]|jgi:heterodisulfide reductase subunit C2
MTTTTTTSERSLLAEVSAGTDFNAQACMNCGVCTSVCPMGIDMLPRKLFHLVVLGEREEVLRNTEAVYSCLLCRMCEVSCPADVKITANVRALRHYLNHHVLGV